jgi:tetratricopeptide (TPR) repeat protein
MNRMRKKVPLILLQIIVGSSTVNILSMTLPLIAPAQAAAQQTPAARPRRRLPKPVGGSRGFDHSAERDASARLIAGAGTRETDDPAIIFYLQGRRDYQAVKYKIAVERFARAVKLKPDWPEAHYALALSLTATSKLKQAIAEFKQVVQLDASASLKTLAYYNLGNSYYDLRQYQQAIEAYKLAIQLDPQSSKSHYNLALTYVVVGRLSDAVAEFDQAVKLTPEHAEAHYNLGLAYLQSGQRQEAQTQQQILIRLNRRLASKLRALLNKRV